MKAKHVLFVRLDDELNRQLQAHLARARAAEPPGRTLSMADLVREILYRATAG